MREVHFYDDADDELLKFAVVAARFRGQWVFRRDAAEGGWRIPRGDRRDGENIEETARRLLCGETVAARFRLSPVCVCGVRDGTGPERLGMFYFAEVQEFFGPAAEAPTELFPGVPEGAAEPELQKALLERALDFCAAGPHI